MEKEKDINHNPGLLPQQLKPEDREWLDETFTAFVLGKDSMENDVAYEQLMSSYAFSVAEAKYLRDKYKSLKAPTSK